MGKLKAESRNMCFFFKQSKDAREVEHRYNAKIENEALFCAQNYINGFTFPQTAVIAGSNPELIRSYDWGLIPSWAKDNLIRKYTLNARIETIAEKPSFRDSVNNRCLVIADGFYEWKWLDAKGKNKQKYLITLRDSGLFGLGGIWSEWKNNDTGKIINSYSIVTTDANDLMSKIHNSKKRMPVILTKQNEHDWLTGKSFDDFRKMDIELTAKEV